TSLDYNRTLDRLARVSVPFLADWCHIIVVREDGDYERVAAVHADPRKAPLLENLARYYPIGKDRSKWSYEVIATGKSVFSPEISEDHLKEIAFDPRHFQILLELGCSSCIVVPIQMRDQVHGSIAFISGKSRRSYDSDDLLLGEE